MQIAIVHGPNLNLLGTREPAIYGNQPFDAYLNELRTLFPEIHLEFFQSNHEGALIDFLHEAGFRCQGIVINAGAYAHTSYALADAISAVPAPVVSVHISNTWKRETFRHTDVLASRCVGVIAGLGYPGYRLAIDYLRQLPG